MHAQPFNILFICSHNSARSIIAEALLRHLAPTRFRAFSAGSTPLENGHVHPLALSALNAHGVPTVGLSSKSWNVFDQLYEPPLDLVITVCSAAAELECPKWPGQPGRAHWGYPDPSIGVGTHEQRLFFFAQTVRGFEYRLKAFIALSDEAIAAMKLQEAEPGLKAQTLKTSWENSGVD
jgi:arsenate reductase (thioredoxin)